MYMCVCSLRQRGPLQTLHQGPPYKPEWSSMPEPYPSSSVCLALRLKMSKNRYFICTRFAQETWIDVAPSPPLLARRPGFFLVRVLPPVWNLRVSV